MDKNKIQSELDKINQAITAQKKLRDTLTDDELAAALAPLQRRQAELTTQLAAAAVSGSGAMAQGTKSRAVGERGVLAEGNVGGSIITGDQSQGGGIQAKTIKAENVVQGMQQLGGDLSQTAEAVALAEALRGGTITADSIEAKNVVAGFQYITDPAQATPDQLRQEVAELKRQLAAAMAAGEVESSTDMADVQDALATAETELDKPEPQGSRIVRKLKEAATILTESAKVTDAARKAGQALIKLAPVASALYQIATNLFGG